MNEQEKKQFEKDVEDLRLKYLELANERAELKERLNKFKRNIQKAVDKLSLLQKEVNK